MSSPAPAATSCEPEAESPLAAEEPSRDVIREDDPGATDAQAVAAELDGDDDDDDDDDDESGEVSDEESDQSQSDSQNEIENAAPPLPNESVPNAPPLPNEAVPTSEDDGWDCQWDANTRAWFFYNRFTGQTQWENPRVPTAAGAATDAAHGNNQNSSGSGPQPPTEEKPAAGGYNPAIHGDYDPNAWYAQGSRDDEEGDYTAAASADPSGAYGATAAFNRFNGSFQTSDAGPERHSDEAKARRQMNTYFDVDAAANAHGGRSLKAERSNKKPTKSELKAFKEKRRARKEEKRRAWLRD